MSNPYPNYKVPGRRRVHKNLLAAETGAPAIWVRGSSLGGFAFITAWLRSILVWTITVDSLMDDGVKLEINGVELTFKDTPTEDTDILNEGTTDDQAATLANVINANSTALKYSATVVGSVVTLTSTEYLDTAPIIDGTNGALIIANTTPTKKATLQMRTYNEMLNAVCHGAEIEITFTGEGPEEIITQVGASVWGFTVKAMSANCRFDSTSYSADGSIGRP